MGLDLGLDGVVVVLVVLVVGLSVLILIVLTHPPGGQPM